MKPYEEPQYLYTREEGQSDPISGTGPATSHTALPLQDHLWISRKQGEKNPGAGGGVMRRIRRAG